MTEEATIWEAVPDLESIDSPFHSIAFAQSPRIGHATEGRTIRVVMHGTRDLCLCFTHVHALRFEDDCPGFDPLPHPLPALREQVTFPLLQIRHSRWLGQWEPFGVVAHDRLTHFALLSLDDLVQLIAGPDVEAYWA